MAGEGRGKFAMEGLGFFGGVETETLGTNMPRAKDKSQPSEVLPTGKASISEKEKKKTEKYIYKEMLAKATNYTFSVYFVFIESSRATGLGESKNEISKK